MERVLEIIVAIDRLHNKLRVRWYDCGCYLCDFGRYFASQFTDDSLNFDEEFVLLILLDFGEKRVLASGVSPQEIGYSELQDAENQVKIVSVLECFCEKISHVGLLQEPLSLFDFVLAVLEVCFVPELDGREFAFLVVLHDELQQDVEEEYLQVSGYFRGRVGVDQHKNADVLLEGDELFAEAIVFF